MADFDSAHRFVARAEGGYQADPRDGGNWTDGKPYRGALVGTRYGISAPVLQRWRGRPITADDMRQLPEAEARAIYRAQYWDALALGDLTSDPLALLLYDGAVNQGPAVARRAALHALQVLGVHVADPAPWPRLAQLLNGQEPHALHELVWQYRRDRYPKDSPFTAGWLKRLDRLRDPLS